MSDTNTCTEVCGPTEPTAEHKWLNQFLGDWDAKGEAFMEPGVPAFEFEGFEHTIALGGLWVIGEGKSSTMEFSYRLTLGYDSFAGKYVGTWADSMTPYLWKYEGAVEGAALVLHTEGPNPHAPGKFSKFRETTKFESSTHRVFTSEVLGENGEWSLMMRVVSHKRS